MVTERGEYSGHADRSHGCCRLRKTGGGYVPPHVGAPVERRDEAEEVSGSGSRSRENSRASLRTNPTLGSDHQTDKWQAASATRVASAQMRWLGWLKTRPENTGAGSREHRGTFRAELPDQMVTGLHDASSGAYGEYCPRKRVCLFAWNWRRDSSWASNLFIGRRHLPMSHFRIGPQRRALPRMSGRH